MAVPGVLVLSVICVTNPCIASRMQSGTVKLEDRIISLEAYGEGITAL